MPRTKPTDPLVDFEPVLRFLRVRLTEENYRDEAMQAIALGRKLITDLAYLLRDDLDLKGMIKLQQELRASMQPTLTSTTPLPPPPLLAVSDALRIRVFEVQAALSDPQHHLRRLRLCRGCRTWFTARRRTQRTCGEEKCRERVYYQRVRKAQRAKTRPVRATRT